MPELEENKDQVTYAQFEASDVTSADFNRQLNQYVLDNLPLTAEQKLEFCSLCRANADRSVDGVRHCSVDE
jgi:hypothetical protein